MYYIVKDNLKEQVSHIIFFFIFVIFFTQICFGESINAHLSFKFVLYGGERILTFNAY